MLKPREIGKFRLTFLSLFTALISGVCMASDSGMQLLEKMAQAADKLDYSGEFVYVHDGHISTMKIVHMQSTDEAPSQQRLMALDGSMREIILKNDVVACVLPDQGMGVREKRQARQLFKLSLSERKDSVIQYYQVIDEGRARVANRDCTQIRISPKDHYRYGYKLCIDTATSLLLSTELYHADGSILESYKFVNVQFEDVEDNEINSRTPANSLQWMDDQPEASKQTRAIPQSAQKWRVKDNSTGFVMDHYIERISPMSKEAITHLVLSDGLAQVSVFVSPAGGKQSSASLNMGSLNSFSRALNEYMITVVGEVPQETVELIAQHTEPY